MSLSIADFQKISNGYHNAGDITLTGRGKLDMVNNHVGVLKGWNTKTISAATTLEVKNAFVSSSQSSFFATTTGLPSRRNHTAFAKPGL